MAKKSKKAINGAIQDAINEAVSRPEIKTVIVDALQTEVFGVIKKYGAIAIQESVYNVYSPRVYDRRYDEGGVLDENNWVISSASIGSNDITMVIEHNSEPNPIASYGDYGTVETASTNKDLSYLIVNGYYTYPAYDFPKDGKAYMRPRDFISKTANKFTGNGGGRSDLVYGMADGIWRSSDKHGYGFSVGTPGR